MSHFIGLFMLLPLMTYPLGVCADIPKLYGDKFVKSGQSWPEGGLPAKNPSSSIAGSVPNSAYSQQLEEFESHGGPYTDSLAEPLLGLGNYHASRGDYKQAVTFYRRALHNVRLNDGLYSQRQGPIVRQLLDTVRLSGDLKALDDRYDYFFGLYGNGHPPFTALRMRAALEYLRWQREAIRLDMDTQEQRRLLDLYQLNENMLDEVMVGTPISIEHRWLLALSQIRNLYLLQSRVAPRVEVTGAGTISTFSARSGQGNEMDFGQRKLETIQRSALVRGREVLENYMQALDSDVSVASAGASVRVKRARALRELGDWHQWNGSYHRADEYYVKAIQLLQKAGELELVRQWFADPVELPDNGVYWQPSASGGEQAPLQLIATYDVTIRGRVKKLSTLDSEPEVQGLVSRFKRELKGTRFRPRYRNGQATFTEKQTREYEVYR